MSIRRSTLTTSHGTVSMAVHEPARPRGPAAFLVPGAGGTLDGDGLVALADLLAGLRHPAVRANLPHHEAGARAPRADRSVRVYAELFATARDDVGARRRWIAGGKSYGGRVGSMAAAEGLDVAGLLFYGYPLHPPAKPDQLRVDHWPAIGVPCLFLQGDRDPFCDLDLLHSCVRKLPRRATIHVVPGGDHSLKVSRVASPTGTASSEAATIGRLGDVVRNWFASLDG